MKSYFTYTRVSTQKQGEKGVSLRAQKDAIARYAASNNLDVSEWFEERETAAKRGRPVFSSMLARLRKGQAAGVIIHKIDRSARNLKDWADLGELIDQGIDVHFAYESLDLNSRGGRLSADIQAIIAADYIRNLKGEVKKGLYGRLKQGIYPFGAPLGYLNQGGGKPKILDPHKAPLVRRAFELYATGTYTLHTLRDELHCFGLTNNRGGHLSINGVSKLLNNPFYCGIIRIERTGETFNGIHEPLISTALFEQVQNVLTGKTNTRAQKHNYQFRRTLKCVHCGYSLIGERQKGRVYYRCHTRDCVTTGVREDIVQSHFDACFEKVQLTDNELAELHVSLAQYDKSWTSEREQLIEGTKLNLDRLKQRSERLTDAFLDDAIEKELFDERRNGLVSETRALQEKLDELQSDDRSIPRRMEKFLERVGSLPSSYISANTYEKRQLIQEVTSNRTVSGKKLAITLREPYCTLARRVDLNSCALNRDVSRTKCKSAAAVLFSTLLEYFNGEIAASMEFYSAARK